MEFFSGNIDNTKIQNTFWQCHTVHSSSFDVLDRISTSQGKQYSTNTDYMMQNGTVRQMNDPLLVTFMWLEILKILAIIAIIAILEILEIWEILAIMEFLEILKISEFLEILENMEILEIVEILEIKTNRNFKEFKICVNTDKQTNVNNWKIYILWDLQIENIID